MTKPKVGSYLNELDESQLEAVTSPPGPLLVLAGPGSGKTRILVARAAWLLENDLARPEEILAITFTNKAAEEVKERLRALLGEETSARLFAGTFHSFALKLLRRRHEEIGLPGDFAVLDEEGQDKAIALAIENLNFSLSAYPIYRVREYISHRKENLQAPDEPTGGDFAAVGMAKIATEYRNILEQQHLIDFDDILVRAIELLGKSRRIRTGLQARLKHILVDEFHDINRAQFELLLMLAPKGTDVAVVADEDQSIYSWRGADPGVISRFLRHYRPKVIELSRNYRSTEAILCAAQSLIGNSPDRMKTGSMKALAEGGAPIRVYLLKDEEEEVKVITRIVEGLHREGYDFGDIAVLYRTHRIAEGVEKALLHAGIPVQRIVPRPYQQSDVRPVHALLRLVAHPDAISLSETINFPQVILDDLTAARIGDLPVDGLGDSRRLTPLVFYNLKSFWEGISLLREKMEEGTEFVLGETLAWIRRRIPPWEEGEISGTEISSILGERSAKVEEASEVIRDALLGGYVPEVREGKGVGGAAAKALLTSAVPMFLERTGAGGKAISLPRMNALEAFAAIHSALVSTEKVGEGEFVVYDLETTGSDASRDQIVEIGAVKLRNRKEVGRFHSLVRPTRPISISAQAVHRIAWKDLKDAPPIEEVLPKFMDFIGNAPVVGHNIRGFDNLIIDRELWRMKGEGFNNPSVDTLSLARHLWPDEPSHSLERMLEKAGLGAEVPHRALEDALREASLFLFLWQELREKQVLLSLMPWLPLAVIGSEPDDLLLRWARRFHSASPEASKLGEWLQGLSPEEEWDAMPWLQKLTGSEEWSKLREFRLQEKDLWELWKRFSEAGGSGFSDFLDFVALQTDLERYDPAEDKVTMLTLHNAKGMEFRVVIIVGVEQGTLPVWRAVGDPEKVAEERRVLYVGMTRAKERLYMTALEERNGTKRSPSQFLSEIPDRFLKKWKSGGHLRGV